VYRALLKTPIGILQLFADDQALYRIIFPSCTRNIPVADAPPKNHRLLIATIRQLNEYFKGERQSFDLPLSPQGTEFQMAVWECIRNIPHGQTRTYGELAAQLGNRNKARAVAGAANKNPLPLVIPCHRVIGVSGKLTGFSGGLEIKRYLLNLEQKKARQPA